jgi:hypothetical protein
VAHRSSADDVHDMRRVVDSFASATNSMPASVNHRPSGNQNNRLVGLSVGDRVRVEWPLLSGHLFPAKVVCVNSDCELLQVHYDGFKKRCALPLYD